MTAEANAALARRYLADVVAGDDPEASQAFLAAGARVHGLVFAGSHGWWPGQGEVLDVDVRDVIATEDRVAVRGTVQGRSAAGHGRYAVAGAWFCHVEDGRIAELWSLPDGLGLVRQLGTLPHPARELDGHDTERDSEL